MTKVNPAYDFEAEDQKVTRVVLETSAQNTLADVYETTELKRVSSRDSTRDRDISIHQRASLHDSSRHSSVKETNTTKVISGPHYITSIPIGGQSTKDDYKETPHRETGERVALTHIHTNKEEKPHKEGEIACFGMDERPICCF